MNGLNRWLNWAVQIDCQNKRSKWTVKMEGQNPTVQMEGRNWTGRNRTVEIGLVEIERSKLDGQNWVLTNLASNVFGS